MEDMMLEKVDEIRRRTGLSYREASELLKKHNSNVVEALIEHEEQQKNWKDEFTVRGAEVVDKVKELIRAGNVNRVKINHDGRTIFEIPVNIGAIGALIAPQLAALGVLVAMLNKCTIEVERKKDSSGEG